MNEYQEYERYDDDTDQKTQELLSEAAQAEDDNELKDLSDYAFDENGHSEDFDLDIGYTDKEGNTHRTFAFREITAKDQEEIHKPAVKNNGGKVINVLLTRAVVRVGGIRKKDVTPKEWENIIRSLHSGDQDLMMLRVREANLGHEIEVKHECPDEDCKASLTTFIDTSEIEMVHFKGEDTLLPFELKRGLKTRKGQVLRSGYMMRLPNGYDREALTPVALKNVAKATTLMLSRIIKFDSYDAPITEDMMSYLTLRDSQLLGKILEDNNFGLKFELETECSSCGRRIRLGLNQINFI